MNRWLSQGSKPRYTELLLPLNPEMVEGILLESFVSLKYFDGLLSDFEVQ